MEYENYPRKIAIIGAAGKMGSGITLLTSIEVTRINLLNQNNSIKLFAMDISDEGLSGLKKYITSQVKRKCEKEFDKISSYYQDLEFDSPDDLSERFLEDIFNALDFVTSIDSLIDIEMIFEAVVEKPELKANLINRVKKNTTKPLIVFSNTSSIPIREIEKATGLEGRVIGFHFYNPPAVQKLVELISTSSTRIDVLNFAKDFSANIGKIIVPSNDVPGFIGNGHFMREIIFAFEIVNELEKQFTRPETIFIVNYISQFLLVRPMGIFQLTDYVGLDVCLNILNVMNERIEGEELYSRLLENLYVSEISGGQNSDGSQKDGIFKYDSGQITGVYDLQLKEYTSVEQVQKKVFLELGRLDFSVPVWKDIIKLKDRQSVFDEYFLSLRESETLGARLAIKYLRHSKLIAETLVNSGVTKNPEDVNRVMMLGFYHAYGPINNFA